MSTRDETTMMSRFYNVHTIWIALLLLTLSTYVMGKIEYSSTAMMLIVLSVAAVKAIFIIRDFMELRGVSLLWRVIMYGWLWIVCIAIAISYIISL